MPNNKRLRGHSLIQFGDSVIIMGGNGPPGKLLKPKNYNHEIYKLTCTNGNFHWTTLPQKMKIGRTEFVAIPIPDSMANCE